MAGEEVEVDEICTNEGMEDIDLSLYIRSELALRPVTSPPHPPLVCPFGFNLSLSSTAQLPSASPRSLSVCRMVRRECLCPSPGLDPSSYTHTQRKTLTRKDKKDERCPPPQLNRSSLSTQSIASIGSKFKPFFLRFPYLDQWEEPPEEAYERIGIKPELASDQPIWCYPALDKGRRVSEKRLFSFRDSVLFVFSIDPVELLQPIKVMDQGSISGITGG
jgi:hypothetical protein